jgi:hypothetical protein
MAVRLKDFAVFDVSSRPGARAHPSAKKKPPEGGLIVSVFSLAG